MQFLEFKKHLTDMACDIQVSLKEIENFLTDYFKGKFIPNLESTYSFVVRCSMNNTGEVFRNISRCSYNPNAQNIKLQRANYPEQTVFYCSIHSDTDNASTSLTCIVETAWEHIENLNQSRSYCTLSRWQCTRPLHLWVLPFCEESCTKNRDFEKIRKHMTELVINDPRYSDDMIQSLKFISDCFAARENKMTMYRITSAFYNSLLYFESLISEKFDGLMYPSANTEGAGVNLVLKKDLIDDKILYCDAAVMYSLSRHPSNAKNLVVIPASNDSEPGYNGELSFTTIV